MSTRGSFRAIPLSAVPPCPTRVLCTSSFRTVPACAAQSGGGSFGELFLDYVAEELDTLDQDLVIVLDDAHRLTNRALGSDLDRLTDGLPRQVRVLIGARWDPPLTLRELRLSGRLVEVRAGDLAFQAAEGALLVARVSGQHLDRELIASLVTRTDGWATGLQLAVISLRVVPDVTAFVADFSGSDQLVVDYLTNEVLDTLDDGTRSFLLQTSVLPWLTADLCDAVTGGASSRTVLEHLVGLSLFMVPLDGRGDRFRYHHLFADLLRYRLRIEQPGHEVDLHRLAATWFQDHGHSAEAIEQTLIANDLDGAFDMISEVGHQFYEQGRSATLVRWLTVIDDGECRTPSLAAVNLLAAQVAAGESIGAAETYRRLCRRTDVMTGERAAADSLYAVLGLDDLPPHEALDSATSARKALAAIDRTAVPDFLGVGGADSVEFMAEFMTGVSRFHKGDVLRSITTLEHTFSLPGMQYAIWKINAIGALSLARAWSGHLREAERLALAAVGAADAAGVSHHQSLFYAHLALGLIAVERHDLGAAARKLAESGSSSRLVTRASFDHLQRLLLARLAAARHDDDGVLAILRAPLRSTSVPPIVDAASVVEEARALVGVGESGSARSVLERTSELPCTIPAIIDLELATGGIDAAEAALQRWRPRSGNVTESVEYLIRTALVLQAQGDPAGAHEALFAAVADAEAECLRRPFLQVPEASRLLSTATSHDMHSFRASILDAAEQAEAQHRLRAELVEPLTERELEVLGYLPSRLSNADIATQLFLSVNTVKTHVRNIYRKLDATDRDAAVTKANQFGLL